MKTILPILLVTNLKLVYYLSRKKTDLSDVFWSFRVIEKHKTIVFWPIEIVLSLFWVKTSSVWFQNFWRFEWRLLFLSTVYKIDQLELKIHKSVEIDHGLQLDEQFLIDHVVDAREANFKWTVSMVFIVLSVFGIAVVARIPKMMN